MAYEQLPLNILYVEDDPAIRELFGSFLKRWSRDITIVNNASEGLDAYRQQGEAIDVIVTDLYTPVFNADVMIEEIKKERPDIKVIITTAFADESVSGCEHIITKPFDFKEVYNLLKGFSS